MDTSTFLSSLQEHFQTQFKQEQTLLSFSEYLDVVKETPHIQIRDSAQYLRDTFDYYGTEDRVYPYGTFKRFKLFDMPFDEGLDSLIGQEQVQNQVYGLLTDFIREGRVNKLILLHGPNGSAKSTFIQCLMRALENYSSLPEG